MKTTDLNLEKFMKRIGNNIRIIREFKKISQEPLCEQINKSQPTLSRYENGYSSMTIDIFFKICQYLDVSLELMISKDLSLADYSSYTNKSLNVRSFKEHKYFFEDRIFNLYYLSTSQEGKIIEADLITASSEEGNYIPFLFEVKHNSPDKRIR